WTQANTWFSSEQGKKGQVRRGQLADFALLSDDYFEVAEDEISRIESQLTVLGGKVVHAAGPFAPLAPSLPAAMPDWSPVRRRLTEAAAPRPVLRSTGCGVHPHLAPPAAPTADAGSFWGALGCSCWAF
ncbi:MAG TPA: amidohydrolase family protein, partial [Polyangiales bacterium]